MLLAKKSWLCDAPGSRGFTIGSSGRRWLNGHALTSLSLTPEEAEQRIDLPAAVQVAGRNELLLEARPVAGRPPRPLMLTRLEVGFDT